MPRAPERFVDWLTNNQHPDKRKTGFVYRYHSRSDSHSKAISPFVLDDLLDVCPPLREHAKAGRVVYGVNLKHLWPNSAKAKTIDLAVGVGDIGPVESLSDQPIAQGPIKRVLISMEAKSVMTEHVKSQPRLFDELGSSHAIVHAGDNNAIAAGITVINIADRFVSPLRQYPGQPMVWTKHNQPHVAERMVKHLRGLPIRQGTAGVGFDAFTMIIVDCDNQNPANLWTEAPAPQPGERDHYETFLADIARAYSERFPAPQAASISTPLKNPSVSLRTRLTASLKYSGSTS